MALKIIAGKIVSDKTDDEKAAGVAKAAHAADKATANEPTMTLSKARLIIANLLERVAELERRVG